MVRDGSLLDNVWITVERIFYGFLLGTIPGVVLGLAMGLFWPARAFFMPISTVVYVIPTIALLPLLLIAFGIGDTSKIVTVALSIFFVFALTKTGKAVGR